MFIRSDAIAGPLEAVAGPLEPLPRPWTQSAPTPSSHRASRRFGDKLVRSLWLRRGAPARARVSVPSHRAPARRLRAHGQGRHLSALIAAGYLTAEGRQGGRAGRKGRGIVPTWSLSTRQKNRVEAGEICRVEKPEKIAAYAQVKPDSVRISTRQNLPPSSRESLKTLSLDSKPAFGGDDWTAPADVPARVADLRAAARPRSRLSA